MIDPNMSIGGSWDCPKCGKHCSGAEYHHCPEDEKQRTLKNFNERTEVTCSKCKKKRMVLKRLHNRPFFGDPSICSECRKSDKNIFWSSSN